MIINESTNRYQKLVHEYFRKTPDLAEYFLKRVPTPAEFRQLSQNELRFIKSQAPNELGKFIVALELGELIVKSPRNLYGHAYTSTLVGRTFVEEYAGDQQESVTILCTDVHNEIIAKQQLFIGGTSQCCLFPDQIFRYALKNCAMGVIVIHNHPSGIIEPSDTDLSMCQRVEQAGNAIGISLLDFMIVGGGKYYSWRENFGDL